MTPGSQHPELFEHDALEKLVASARNRPFVLLEDTLHASGAQLFTSPREIITCTSAGKVDAALEAMEDRQRQGFYLAGFLSYELGYAFEPRLHRCLPAQSPTALLWFGAFDAPHSLSATQTDRFLGALRQGDYQVKNLVSSMEQAAYEQAIGNIHDLIAAGDSYQVNFTFKHHFEVAGDTTALYQQLRQRQPVAYSALLATGDQHILSLSPELFIRRKNNLLTTRPMKGTTARGTTPDEDAANRDFLTRDPKSRAENLMIVDLLRNDIGRVCETGSVTVTDLFTVESYQSLHQMTSGITGQAREGLRATELIRALFPCGSITGAPRIRTMEIIHELECAPRGLYTGSIGMIAPDDDLCFNVAIRTLVIDAKNNKSSRGELGIGSGIVHDSVAADEYRECLLKGQFLSAHQAPSSGSDFFLIETLRWTEAEGYWLLDDHLARLRHSADFFGYRFGQQAVMEALNKIDPACGPLQRVRLLLGRDGECTVTRNTLDQAAIQAATTFTISEKTIDSTDPFFYHKTTRRTLYDTELAQQTKQKNCDEVVFLNERGEVAEGARSNIFIEKEGQLLTPPLTSGLLNGVLRRHLLRKSYKGLREQMMTIEDLRTADQVFLGNSVRGLMKATEINTKISTKIGPATPEK